MERDKTTTNLTPSVIILNASGGFCNRIIPVICCFSFCLERNVHLAVVWPKTKYVHGQLLALSCYFEKLPPLLTSHDTLDHVMKHYKINQKKIKVLNMKGGNQIPDTDILNTTHPLLITNVHHVFSLCPNKFGVTTMFAPQPIKAIYEITNHPLVHHLRRLFHENFQINSKVANYIQNNKTHNVGIHLRTLDGGFKKRWQKERQHLMSQLRAVIDNTKQSETIWLASDNKDVRNTLLQKHTNIFTTANENLRQSQIPNEIRFLIDLVQLSRCGTMYCTPSSSFGFFAFIMNENPNVQLHYFNLFDSSPPNM